MYPCIVCGQCPSSLYLLLVMSQGARGDQGYPGQKGEKGDGGLPGPPGLPGRSGLVVSFHGSEPQYTAFRHSRSLTELLLKSFNKQRQFTWLCFYDPVGSKRWVHCWSSRPCWCFRSTWSPWVWTAWSPRTPWPGWSPGAPTWIR